VRAPILVLMMIVIAPAGQVIGEEESVNTPTVVFRDILGTYSRSVQNAFDRVSDIDSYEEEELAEVESWLVVTGIPIDEHKWTEAKPEDIEPVKYLKGSYIWTFEDSRNALEQLRKSSLKEEIESFSPLLEKSVSPRF